MSMEFFCIFFSFARIYFIYLFFYFTILYGFLPYINMNLPRVYPCSPSWTPPPTSLPIPSLWVFPVHQPRASCIMHWTWTGNLFHIWYYTCFSAILPNHPTLALSHRVQKTVLYICVSFCCLAYRVIVTIFLNSIYMHYYTVLVFFFLAYFTLYNRLQFHPPH